MLTFSKLVAGLQRFTGRTGLTLLTLVLFADVYAWVVFKMPLLDVLAVKHATPGPLALAAVGLTAFRFAARFVGISLRRFIRKVRLLLLDLADKSRAVSLAVGLFDGVLWLKDDGNWQWAAEKRSRQLLTLALGGCGPALEVYNERARRAHAHLDLANHSIAFVLLMCASMFMGPHSVAAYSSAALTAVHPAAPTVVAWTVGWALLVMGLNAPDEPDLELDVLLALPKPEKAEAPDSEPLRRAVD
jgi:hypothetical protein